MHRYNTISNSIELEESTVVDNETIVPSAEVEATLVEFSAKLFEIAPIGKTWKVNEKGFCETTRVSQLTYLTGKHSTYVNDEAGPLCSYFSRIIIDTNIMIERPSNRDYVIGSRSGIGYDRVNELVNEQTELLDYYSNQYDSKKGGPISNAAGIYTNRVILCILANYYTDKDNQRWRILKKSGNEYMEATHVDAFKALKDKYYNKKKKKKNKRVRDDDDDDDGNDDDGMQE